jgi:CRISPR-associated protein Csx16
MKNNITSIPSTWFVSGHLGSINWIKKQSTHIDHFVSHLDETAKLNCGDIVIGSLPIHLIAQLNSQGIRFISFQLDLPEHSRETELTEQQLTKLNVKMQEYIVWGVDS